LQRHAANLSESQQQAASKAHTLLAPASMNEVQLKVANCGAGRRRGSGLDVLFHFKLVFEIA
jgi:hypothetical protein